MDEFLAQDLGKLFRWPSLRRPGAIDTSALIKPGRSFTLCEPKKRIGIEIEVEGVPNGVPTNPELWSAHADGSLRGGIEYVTMPVAGHEVVAAVYDFYDNLPRNADFSERTSIHIHINVREQTVDQLLTILLLYVVFERSLYQFAGMSRFKNIFCVPIQQTRYPYMLADFFVHRSLPELIRVWKKYSGLNLRRMSDLGTLEYRHMEGHRDPIRLLNWINLLLRTHRYSRRNKFLDVYEEVRMLNTSSMYEHFMRKVFEEDTQLLQSQGDAVRMAMESGVTTAKHVNMPSPFYQSLLTRMNDTAPLLKSLGISSELRRKIITKPLKPEALPISDFERIEGVLAQMRDNSAAFQRPVGVGDWVLTESEIAEDLPIGTWGNPIAGRQV